MLVIENFEKGLVNGIFKLKDVGLNYCTTSHKYQGMAIDEEYNIYQSSIMSFENFYTAISRCRNMDLVHLNLKEGVIFKSEYENGNGLRVIKHEKDDGLVYEINGFDEDVEKWYVGMTSRNKDIRMDEHETNPKSACFKLTDKKIRVIGRVLGGESRLRQFEKDYIGECKMVYGDNCINRNNFKRLIGNPLVDTLIKNKWEVVENTGKIYQCTNQFKLKWNVGETGDKKEKIFRYAKKGKEVVLEEVKNWCVLNEIVV